MTDLRKRLVGAIKPLAGGEPALHGTNEEEIADEALAIFAAWLRERGGERWNESLRVNQRDEASERRYVQLTARAFELRQTAEEINPA